MRRLLFLIFLFPIISVAQNPDAVIGRWKDEYNSKIVEIYKKDNYYFGKIVWLKDSLNIDGSRRRDIYNENEAKRTRLLLGTDVLMYFRWDKNDNEWDDGKIYSEFSGNTYNAKMWISDGALRVKGYYSFLFFLGRTRTWTREPYKHH